MSSLPAELRAEADRTVRVVSMIGTIQSVTYKHVHDGATRALLHRAADALEWRDMASAPKDGTYILVANRHGAWIAKWKPVFQSGFRPSNPWASMMLNHDHIEKPGRFDHPTHWRPLDAPLPATPEGDNNSTNDEERV